MFRGPPLLLEMECWVGIWEWGSYVQSIGQRSRQLDFKARTESGWEASFQRVISMPLTSCLSKSQLSPAMVDSSRTCAVFIERHLHVLVLHFCSASGEARRHTSDLYQCRQVWLNRHPCTIIWNILFRQDHSGWSIYRQIARRKLHKICENGLFPLQTFCTIRATKSSKILLSRGCW